MSDTQTLARSTPERPRPSLSDADLRDIEAQMDDTSPIYLPTLIRDLREARELIALMVEARR